MSRLPSSAPNRAVSTTRAGGRHEKRKPHLEFFAEPEVTDALNILLPQEYSFLLACNTKRGSVIKRWAHPEPHFNSTAPTESRQCPSSEVRAI